MCDTYQPLKLTQNALDLEQGDYHTTWVELEDSPAK